jgi:hypothetical protein
MASNVKAALEARHPTRRPLGPRSGNRRRGHAVHHGRLGVGARASGRRALLFPAPGQRGISRTPPRHARIRGTVGEQASCRTLGAARPRPAMGARGRLGRIGFGSSSVHRAVLQETSTQAAIREMVAPGAQETGAPNSSRHEALGTLLQQSSGVRERRDADRALWAEAPERARARRVPRGFGEIPSSASGASPAHATREPRPQSRGLWRSPPSRRRAICRRRIHARLWNSCTACTARSRRSRGSRSGRCLSTYPSSNATVAQSALS